MESSSDSRIPILRDGRVGYPRLFRRYSLGPTDVGSNSVVVSICSRAFFPVLQCLSGTSQARVAVGSNLHLDGVDLLGSRSHDTPCHVDGATSQRPGFNLLRPAANVSWNRLIEPNVCDCSSRLEEGRVTSGAEGSRHEGSTIPREA